MKPQEGELVAEISKLQCMVSELKAGFSTALLELSKIQHGDTFLREELEENRRSCHKKAIRLEALVESLKEELGVMQCQILQLYSTNRRRPQPDGKGTLPKQRETDSGVAVCERSQCECSSGPSTSSPRGKVLLQSYLQGLKAGLCEGKDARHQVAMQLLHSEWEYVSTLNQLFDKYKTPPALHMNFEPYQAFLKSVEQLLQRHLLFRNTLQERLSAEHWKSLVGDILVQLIGHNDTSFTDMYIGYTTTLATFLSLEFNRLNTEKAPKMQSGHMEREELKLLSLLLAPVSRIHSYLSHIQDLLQWTGKEHPDCSLLLGTERSLRNILSRCHVILEEEVQWENEAAGQSCSGAPPVSSAKCRGRSHTREIQPPMEEYGTATQRDNQQTSNLTNGCHTLNVERWSCSPVRRKSRERSIQRQSAHDCACNHGDTCHLLNADTPVWGDNSDSGQGTSSQPIGRSGDEASHANHYPEDSCETDPDDTSAFDYSSVTSCSPESTLMGMAPSASGEEDDEEDSQVPVLLKPTCTQQQMRDTPRERTVCVRWQIPRLTPHPPLRNPTEGLTPCLVKSHGKRLVSIRKGSPPLHRKSAFRPIWDDPARQVDTAPEKDNRQSFMPVPVPGRPAFQNFNTCFRPGLTQQTGGHAGPTANGGIWDDSEDSEGPCSTV